MAVEIDGKYTGKLGTEMTHGHSGAVLATAAPLDNQGDGSAFSPTDLVAAALASCVVTTMALVAERDGLDFSNVTFRVEKHMSTEPPRIIARIPLVIYMPPGLPAAARVKLERAAHHCPVHRSLLPEIEKDIQFEYPD